MAAETRVAVVTGGGRGIGRGIALKLAELGFALVINYRTDLASRDGNVPCGRAAWIAACNRDRRRHRRARRRAATARRNDPRTRIESTYGSIMPGLPLRKRSDLLETTAESWDRVLDTNLRGPVLPDPGRCEIDDRLDRCGHRRRASNRVHHFDFEHVSRASHGQNTASRRLD